MRQVDRSRLAVSPREEPLRDVLLAEAARLGQVLGPGQADRLLAYLALVERWGRRLNLTGRPERPVLIERQIPDALVLAGLLGAERTPSGSALDVGAGAGLVGIPLALLRPGLRVGLVEASRRKCAFLRTAVHELALTADVHEGRLEDLRLPRAQLVLSRATWPPGVWVRLGAALLEPGGLLVAFLAREEPPGGAGLLLEQVADYRLRDGSPRRLGLWRRTGSCGPAGPA
jgi:16S rRNA (guanine527-N7)-methyltransferase